MMSGDAATRQKRSRWALWLPLGLFAAFLLLVFYGLVRPANRDIESAMVGKPLPEFALPQAVPEREGLSKADFATGEPSLLNIFASWCIPCAIEAPQLEQLRQEGVTVNGIAIRDRTEDLNGFLERNGNPFARIGADNVSAVQLGIGSSGVPETFVIDGQGVIRYQHIGVVRDADLPLIRSKLMEAGQ